MTIKLFLLQPETVFTCQVNQSAFTYPIRNFRYDNPSGSASDAKPGMTMLLGSTAGADDLGRQRLTASAVDSGANEVNFGYSSQGTRDGELNVSDDAHVTILNDFRVWARIPIIDSEGVVYKDGDLAVSDNTTNPPPVANTGPGTAGTIDSGTSVLTVTFDGSASFATADGASISSYSWDVDDGTITSGATSASMTATFPAGFRWVALTVTDSNGKTHTARCPVYARDPANDTTISAFEIESHRITPQGQQLAVRIPEDVAEGTYPDGTLVMLWEDEPSSASDRSHVLFIGWHDTDPAQVEATRTGTLRGTVLNCLDVAGKLDKLPGFPQEVEAADSPSTWMEMSSPHMDKYLHYLLHWYSTALDVADWTDTGTGSTYPFVILGSEGESLFDQVNRRANALVPDYHLTCNTLGQLQTVVDPMLVNTGSRTATVQATLTEADWSDVRYTHQRPPRIHWHRANAIKASSTVVEALFCIAPGESPGQGELAQEHGEQLAVSQGTLNDAEGHRYARHNAPQGYFSITLAQGDDLGIEPADMTWVRLTVSSATAAQRGLAFTTERGLVREMTVRYDHTRTGLVRTVELLWERETSGTPAVTVIPPVAAELPGGSDDDDFWGDDYFDEDPTTPASGGFGTVYALDDSDLYRTDDLSVTSPTWTAIGPGGVTTYDFILDPWVPETTGYLGTDAGLYKSTNLDQASPTWTLVLSAADILSATGFTYQGVMKVSASVHAQNYVAVFYAASTTRVYCSFSEDGGSTWTTGLISSAFASVTQIAGTHADREGGSVGLLYAAHNTTGGRLLFESTDKGATWSTAGTMASASNSTSVGVHVPYNNNGSGDIVYAMLSTGAWKTTNGGSSFTALPAATAAKYGVGTFTEDSNQVYQFRADNTFWTSTDGGSTWTQKNATGLSGTVRAVSGFPYASGQFYALTTAGVFVSTNGGASWTDKTGDLSIGTISQYFGGTIVPLWTE